MHVCVYKGGIILQEYQADLVSQPIMLHFKNDSGSVNKRQNCDYTQHNKFVKESTTSTQVFSIVPEG